LHGFVVVKVASSGGRLAKVVGGTPEHPSLLGLSESDEPLVKYETVGAATMEVTWVDWYNTSAGPNEQAVFDDVTRRIDAGGMDALPGGTNAGMIDQYRFTHPKIYPALLNYRDTGGRRALFAKNTVAYSDKPISVVKPGGPMEKGADGTVVLHPGRYTYSDANYENPKAGRFKIWLTAAIRDKKLQVLRTQVGEGLLADVPVLSVVSTPYYTDYEMLVAVDTAWSDSLAGLPSWIPGTEDIRSYWGKPTPHGKPDLSPLQWPFQFGEQILTLAVVLGLGYVLLSLGKSSPATRHA
jgi:hypothetical protein